MIPTMQKSALIMASVLLTACSQQPQQNDQVANASVTIAPAANEPPPETPVNPPAPGEPGGLPDDRMPVSEGPIDPKSAQGAGQVLQAYFALVEQGEFTEANNLWSDAATKLDLTKYNEVHANIGGPGNMEGAAGSR